MQLPIPVRKWLKYVHFLFKGACVRISTRVNGLLIPKSQRTCLTIINLARFCREITGYENEILERIMNLAYRVINPLISNHLLVSKKQTVFIRLCLNVESFPKVQSRCTSRKDIATPGFSVDVTARSITGNWRLIHDWVTRWGWRRANSSRQAQVIRQFPVTRGDGKTSFLCWRSEPPQETYTTAQPLGQDRDFRQTTPQSSLSGIGLSFGEFIQFLL